MRIVTQAQVPVANMYCGKDRIRTYYQCLSPLKVVLGFTTENYHQKICI